VTIAVVVLGAIQTVAAPVAIHFAKRAADASRDAVRLATTAREEERAEAQEARKARERERFFGRSKRIGELASIVNSLRYSMRNELLHDIEQGQIRLRVLLVGVDLDVPKTRSLADVDLGTPTARAVQAEMPDEALKELQALAKSLRTVEAVTRQLRG
jgi:hypothetical protein